MTIVTSRSSVHGWHTMCLAGAILSTGDHMLIDIGMTHNSIDINFTCLIGFMEQRIKTIVLHGQVSSNVTTLPALPAIMRAACQQAAPLQSPSPSPYLATT
jgi:hypothetical protein